MLTLQRSAGPTPQGRLWRLGVGVRAILLAFLLGGATLPAQAQIDPGSAERL